MTTLLLTGTLPADLHIENLFSRPFQAQRVKPQPGGALPGYSPVTLTATVKGVVLDVTTLKMDSPTTRRGLTL